MEKLIATTLLLFVAVGLSFAQTIHQKYIQKSTHKIKVDEKISTKLQDEIASGKAYLIDVRSVEEYQAKHLKNAKNIDIKSPDFISKIHKLDHKKPIYLYCHSGNRSGHATDQLIEFGYNESYNIGGLDSLEKAGFAVIK